MVVAKEKFDKLLASLSSKQVTLYQISYVARMDARTIRNYLEIIEFIQSSPKLKKEIKGARVVYRIES